MSKNCSETIDIEIENLNQTQLRQCLHDLAEDNVTGFLAWCKKNNPPSKETTGRQDKALKDFEDFRSFCKAHNKTEILESFKANQMVYSSLVNKASSMLEELTAYCESSSFTFGFRQKFLGIVLKASCTYDFVQYLDLYRLIMAIVGTKKVEILALVNTLHALGCDYVIRALYIEVLKDERSYWDYEVSLLKTGKDYENIIKRSFGKKQNDQGFYIINKAIGQGIAGPDLVRASYNQIKRQKDDRALLELVKLLGLSSFEPGLYPDLFKDLKDDPLLAFEALKKLYFCSTEDLDGLYRNLKGFGLEPKLKLKLYNYARKVGLYPYLCLLLEDQEDLKAARALKRSWETLEDKIDYADILGRISTADKSFAVSAFRGLMDEGDKKNLAYLIKTYKALDLEDDWEAFKNELIQKNKRKRAVLDIIKANA